jgi:hypothetical protein
MIVALAFTLGFAIGAFAYRRGKIKQMPHLPRGMVRHTFHVDLPTGEMPELAQRGYYAARKRMRL